MAKLLDPDGFIARYLVRYVYHNIAPHCHYALPSTARRPQLSPCSTVLSWPSPTPSIKQALHATYAAGRHCTLPGVTLFVSANLGCQLIAEKDEMRPGALVVRNFVIFAAKHEARVPLCVTPSGHSINKKGGRMQQARCYFEHLTSANPSPHCSTFHNHSGLMSAGAYRLPSPYLCYG